MERSFERMRTREMALMQVHNLLDVDTHLPTPPRVEGRG
jgi:hypothetical protein